MKILRAQLLHLCSDLGSQKGYRLEYMPDVGLLLSDQGIIVEKAEASELIQRLPQCPIQDERPHLLVPSFIDTHIHFPQMDMIGACAASLLPWLQTYTFPAEMRFRGRGKDVAESARIFARELLRQGTSLAAIYSSSDYEATDLLFEALDEHGLRAIIGKVSMDQHAPAALLVPEERDRRETEALIKRWHQKDGRLYYALSPRFAPSCSPTLLRTLAQMSQQDSSLYIQTHYAENEAEIAWVKQLYPKARDYLDVYDSYGLLGPRTILAHAIHTEALERQVLSERGIIISHCPSSNLFLGSGLMPFAQYQSLGLGLSLGTDVGAGTSFSLWQTMNEAYKVAQLRQERVEPEDFFYASTLGAAQALGFPRLGSLEAGFEADLQILDLSCDTLMERRWQQVQSDHERLSALIHSINDRFLSGLMIRGRMIRP